ncbi:DUF305 domain-containing protein [Brevundimonas faecalis]|uniref:Uncharacterized protein (DUF305 family) n=1 Tax=Brevundimonas faecalis TaxID=947378 RepID=A0ABV2REZ6_9CAUL
MTHSSSYRMLAISFVLHFIIMYLVMYAMIATLDHFRLNLDNVYMTLMMAAPMTLLMVATMPSMYPSRCTNLPIAVLVVAVFGLSFWGMRTQAGIGDKELIRAMIPHHSGAVLMCDQAKLSDPELIRLCDGIIEAQKKEIAQMETILARL